MSKFGQFLKETSEISNKERLIGIGCTLILTGVGLALNEALFRQKMKSLDKDDEILDLKYERHELKKEISQMRLEKKREELYFEE